MILTVLLIFFFACSVSHDNEDSSLDTSCQTRWWFPDNDLDGYGTKKASIEACDKPSLYYSIVNTDCDDNNSSTYPDAPELCDGLKNNCNNPESDIYYEDRDLITYYPFYPISFEDPVPYENEIFEYQLSLTYPGTYKFCPGTYEASIRILSSNITLEGNATIDARSKNSVIIIEDSQSIVISGLTLTSGNADRDQLAYKGGGIYCTNSSITLEDLWIRKNTATRGGGIYASDCNIAIENVSIDSNSATFGAGIYLQAEKTTSTLNGRYLDFSKNIAEETGGAIHSYASTVDLKNINLRDNSSSSGGAWYSISDTVNLDYLDLQRNSAFDAAGILLSDSKFTILQGKAEENSTENVGGAFLLNNQATLDISNFAITQNTALQGAGVYQDLDSVFTWTNIQWSLNSKDDIYYAGKSWPQYDKKTGKCDQEECYSK